MKKLPPALLYRPGQTLWLDATNNLVYARTLYKFEAPGPGPLPAFLVRKKIDDIVSARRSLTEDREKDEDQKKKEKTPRFLWNDVWHVFDLNSGTVWRVPAGDKRNLGVLLLQAAKTQEVGVGEYKSGIFTMINQGLEMMMKEVGEVWDVLAVVVCRSCRTSISS